MAGMVYFVGAGPGDPELITMKALRVLQQADMVIYDPSVHPQLIKHAGAEAERIAVEKVAADESSGRDMIKRLMASKAKSGKSIVRLTSDDPFVGGSCGEEAAYLSAKQVAFEVIPGIPSVLAAPAYAGIPILYDSISSSFSVITDIQALDQEHFAEHMETLIFMIKPKELPVLVRKLRQLGHAPTTTLALLQGGTTAKQTVVVDNLADIEAKVEEFSLQTPVIIMVGSVVRLREKLQWLETKPLFGQRVLITRSQQQSKPLAEKIRALGGEPLVYPMVKMIPPRHQRQLDQALARIDEFDWIVFTSANGVKFFLQRMKEKSIDIRKLAQAKIAVVGPKTRKALAEHGLWPDCMPKEHVAEALVAALRLVVSPGDQILLPRANLARNLLPNELEKMGCQVEAVHAYDTIAASEDVDELVEALQANSIDIITFTSSSTVRNFQQALAKATTAWQELLKKVKVVCLGPITAQTAQAVGLTVDAVADPYTIEGLVKAIRSTI